MKKLQEFTKHYQKELNYHIQGHTYEQQKSSIINKLYVVNNRSSRNWRVVT
jgi:hypothetical protein